MLRRAPLILLAWARVAAAGGERESIALHYDAPAECPDRAVLEAAIRERTLAAQFAANASRTFAITIAANAEGYRGSLVVDGGESRELTAHRCDDLVTALALVAALAIDPSAGATVVAAPPPSQVPREAWQRAGTLGAMIEVGATPDPLLTGVVEGTLARGWLALAVAGLVGYDRASLDMGHARFVFAAGRASGCWRTAIRTVEVAGCAHFEAGAMQATGEDIAQGRSLTRLWLATGAHARVRWPVSSAVYGQLQAGASVPFQRDRYLFQPNVTIEETSIVTGWLWVGVGMRFP